MQLTVLGHFSSMELTSYKDLNLFQRLDERDFGEQREINKRKRMIQEGKVGLQVSTLRVVVSLWHLLEKKKKLKLLIIRGASISFI